MHRELILLHDVSNRGVTWLLLILNRVLEDASAVDGVLWVDRLVLREGRILLVLFVAWRLVALPVVSQGILEGNA